MEKKIGIIQSNFLPWKGYFDFIASVDNFVFYDTCQYTKRDWRNRNRIKVLNGSPWISVPVHTKGKFHQQICETKISDESWAQNIWNKLDFNYKSAPHFEFVRKTLFEDCLFKIKSINLSEVNQEVIKYICREMLGIKTEFFSSQDFSFDNDRNLKLIQITRALGGTEYVSGQAAKVYLDEKLFTENKIKLSFMSYDGYSTYNQLGDDFDHFVSILDLLMMEGPNAKNKLLTNQKSSLNNAA